MRFLSTRGRAPEIGFRDAVLSGLAPDGGLYMPAKWPRIPNRTQGSFRNASFSSVVALLLSAFAGDEIEEAALQRMAERAYAAFDVPDVAPLRPLVGDDWMLELFHGPTLAFKDVAMRMLAELYSWALSGTARGKTIIGATSGDTGGAAISAFAGKPNVEIFMLHPKGRVSDVQRRMMTTVDASNVVNIAVEGSFDDCQRIVKLLFADAAMNREFDLGGVNSINWVRLAVQAAYYFTATAALGRAASFIVPTGNFGDVFAGYAAKQMGLPVRRLGVAVNANDIMKRVLTTGAYEPQPTTPTSSPSMDIQVASNFERLLFEAGGRDPEALNSIMSTFEKAGKLTLAPALRASIASDFVAESASEDEVARKIASACAGGVLVDPHTAVGLVALEKLREANAISGPAVVLATAHPAKFPDAVERACGVRPQLPARFDDLMRRPERLLEAPPAVDAVRTIIVSASAFRNGV